MTGSSSQSVVNNSKSSQPIHWHNELLASFTAGSIAAMVSNGFETVAVNKQADKKLTLTQLINS